MASENAAARIASQLRAEIMHGDIAPGSKLGQVGLAERFGVSRIPVRDALSTLAGEGLVEPQANATAVVTPMSVGELQELYDLREAIEPMATRLALPNVGRADILFMRKQLAVMAHTDDPRTWLAANTEFHAAVYRRSNRPRTIELIEQLRRQTDRYIYVHLEAVGRTRRLEAEHENILVAVEGGDGPLLARLTREHLGAAHDSILTQMLENPSVIDVRVVLSP
jgi:DNA-binding GntR family transcriptional regulator